MKKILLNLGTGFIVSTIIFVISIPFLADSGRSYSNNPVCTLEEQRNQNTGLKQSHKCYRKLTSEGRVQSYTFKYVLVITIIVLILTRAPLFSLVVFPNIAYIFWLLAWSLVIKIFHFAVLERYGWFNRQKVLWEDNPSTMSMFNEYALVEYTIFLFRGAVILGVSYFIFWLAKEIFKELKSKKTHEKI